MSSVIPKNNITERILWRVHEANLAGTKITVLARANRVNLQQLKVKLAAWRKLHDKSEPVRQVDLMAAVKKLAPGNIDRSTHHLFQPL